MLGGRFVSGKEEIRYQMVVFYPSFGETSLTSCSEAVGKDYGHVVVSWIFLADLTPWSMLRWQTRDEIESVSLCGHCQEPPRPPPTSPPPPLHSAETH